MLSGLLRRPFTGASSVVFGQELSATVPFDIVSLFDATDVSLVDRTDVTDNVLLALALRNGNIRSLSISGCPCVNAEGVLELCSRQKNLESVHLRNCAHMFSNWKALRSENAAEHKRQVHNEELLIRLFGTHPSLRDLDFSGCSFLCSDAIRLLCESRTLVNLRLRDVQSVTDGDVGIIATIPSLKILVLDGCVQLTNAAASALLNSSVTSISMCFCPRLTSAAAGLFGKMPLLAELNLAGNIAIQSYFHTFENHGSLKALDVSQCMLSDTELSIIATISGLMSLSLDSCEALTDRGMSQLSNLKRLESLSVSRCPGVISFRWICNLWSLKSLNLALNPQVSDDDLYAVSGALSSLTSLDVSDCVSLTNRTVESFLFLRELRELCIRGCTSVGDVALRSLLRHENLISVDISGTCISRTCLVGLDDSFVDINSACVKAVANACFGQLDLSGSVAVSDKSIASLAGMKLSLLNISGCNDVTNASIRALSEHEGIEQFVCDGTRVSSRAFRCMTTSPAPGIVKAVVLVARALDLTTVPVSAGLLRFLSSDENLEALDLTDCVIGDDELPILANSRSLNSLNLSRTRVTAAGMKEILRFAEQPPNAAVVSAVVDEVHALDLTASESFGTSLLTEEILELLCSSPSLCSLSLDGCVVPVSSLRKALSKAVTLIKLGLVGCTQVTDDVFCEILSHCPRLESVDIRGCIRLGRKSICALAERPELRECVCVGCGLRSEEESEQDLFADLQTESPSECVVNAVIDAALALFFSGRRMGMSLCRSISANRNLVVADLSSCGISDEMVRILAVESSLFRCTLENNPISCQCLKGDNSDWWNVAVLSAIVDVTNALDLSGSLVRDELVVFLSSLSSLRELSLENCVHVSNLGIRSLLRSSNLVSLNLSGTRVTRGVPAEAKGVWNLPVALEVARVCCALDCSDCSGVTHEMLKGLSTIPMMALILDGCNVDDAGIDCLCGGNGNGLEARPMENLFDRHVLQGPVDDGSPDAPSLEEEEKRRSSRTQRDELETWRDEWQEWTTPRPPGMNGREDAILEEEDEEDDVEDELLEELRSFAVRRKAERSTVDSVLTSAPELVAPTEDLLDMVDEQDGSTLGSWPEKEASEIVSPPEDPHLKYVRERSSACCASLTHLSLRRCTSLSDIAVYILRANIASLGMLDLSECTGLTNACLRTLVGWDGLRGLSIVECDEEKLSFDAFRGNERINPKTFRRPSGAIGGLQSPVKSLLQQSLKRNLTTEAFSPVVLCGLVESLFGCDLSNNRTVSEKSLECLRHSVWVERFSVRGTTVGDGGLRLFMTFDNLEVLDLSYCVNIGTEDDAIRVVEMLEVLKLLKRVSFYGCWRVSDSVLRSVVAHPRLEEVDVGRCNVTEEGISLLSNHSIFTNIGLSGCVGVSEAFLLSLTTLPNLSSLDLSHTAVGPLEVAALSALPALNTLSLARCARVDDDCISHLRLDSKIQSLSVSQTRITEDGMRFLATKLHISDLDVSYCSNIHDFRILRTPSCTLYRVDLSGCTSLKQKDLEELTRNPGLMEVETIGCPGVTSPFCDILGDDNVAILDLQCSRMNQERAARAKAKQHRKQYRFQRTLETEIKMKARAELMRAQFESEQESLRQQGPASDVDSDESGSDERESWAEWLQRAEIEELHDALSFTNCGRYPSFSSFVSDEDRWDQKRPKGEGKKSSKEAVVTDAERSTDSGDTGDSVGELAIRLREEKEEKDRRQKEAKEVKERRQKEEKEEKERKAREEKQERERRQKEEKEEKAERDRKAREEKEEKDRRQKEEREEKDRKAREEKEEKERRQKEEREEKEKKIKEEKEKRQKDRDERARREKEERDRKLREKETKEKRDMEERERMSREKEVREREEKEKRNREKEKKMLEKEKKAKEKSDRKQAAKGAGTAEPTSSSISEVDEKEAARRRALIERARQARRETRVLTPPNAPVRSTSLHTDGGSPSDSTGHFASSENASKKPPPPSRSASLHKAGSVSSPKEEPGKMRRSVSTNGVNAGENTSKMKKAASTIGSVSSKQRKMSGRTYGEIDDVQELFSRLRDKSEKWAVSKD